MRLDKYLKVSRLIKRRTVANEVADAGRILINGKVAKASQAVKAGDLIEVTFGNPHQSPRALRCGAPHQGCRAGDVRDPFGIRLRQKKPPELHECAVQEVFAY